MDGYALRAADVEPGRALAVVATIAAGHAPAALPPGTAARIMTGAPMPAGADAVIMREDATEHDAGARVSFARAARPGQHVRRAGEDVAPGDVVLDEGALLMPGEIGLLAGLGRTIVAVRRRPRVAILSTGDELVEPDRAPAPGAPSASIVGSNSWALAAQCHEAGALPTVLPIARDDRAVIREAFAEALRADAVISSGGVSVGEFDFVKAALDELGVAQSFWKVAMKPGKPIAFGAREGRPVFGLPGNPASSMVTFELFVRPALLRMAGAAPEACTRPRATVELEAPYRNDGGRRHFVRARVRRDGARLLATPLVRQGSGMLRSMVGVNALLDVDESGAPLAEGARLPALLLATV
jgi:molybdopterin molybdotransferase